LNIFAQLQCIQNSKLLPDKPVNDLKQEWVPDKEWASFPEQHRQCSFSWGVSNWNHFTF